MKICLTCQKEYSENYKKQIYCSVYCSCKAHNIIASNSAKIKWTNPIWRCKRTEQNRLNAMKAGDATRGKRKTEETIKKMRESWVIRRSSPNYSIYLKKVLALASTSEANAKRSKTILDMWKNPNYRKHNIVSSRKADTRRSISLIKAWADPKRRKQQSIHTKQLWKNTKYRNKVVSAVAAALDIKPNNKEIMLGQILDAFYPDEYEYTGSGKLVIDGLIPDYANKNGKKELIELYGDYWHRNDNPQDRINKFAGLGYPCLVIWEHELTNISKVAEIVEEFRNKNKGRSNDSHVSRCQNNRKTLLP